MKRLVLLLILLMLGAALALRWHSGTLTAAATLPTAPQPAEDRFGIRLAADGAWIPLPDKLPERLVLLVHGLDEPGDLWQDLAPVLEGAEVPTARFDYPNDQAIPLSATLLGTWLARLRQRGTTQVAIVAHSMGGLVCREYLTNPAFGYRKNLREGTVPRIRTLIMVGTPNQGAPMARFRLVAEAREQWHRFLRGEGDLPGILANGDGQAGRDLLPGSEFLLALNSRELPADVRFAIVAGLVSPLAEDELAAAKETWRRKLPGLLHGPIDQIEGQVTDVLGGLGDGVVSLAATRLPGVEDHTTVRGNHIAILRGGGNPPPAVPIVLDRVERTWPGRYPKLAELPPK
ncbi:MAG: alpha/beta fold hydrolase [Lentisphaeria bacterium]|nr:alpha/beta fold hydrolase [Lentisphaeria bacterium]